jgi:hypothetical protein
MHLLFFLKIMTLSNPSQPPLNRGGASMSLPLLRGSWRGFETTAEFRCLIVMHFGTLNNIA